MILIVLLSLLNYSLLHDETFKRVGGVDKNSKEILEILISKGADINATDIIYLNLIILFLMNGI